MLLTAGQSIQSPDGSHTLAFQGDGNFVSYDSVGTPVWASGTNGSGSDRVAMQNDGNLVIYAGASPVFATNTQPNPLARLHLGNNGLPMILRIDGVTLWEGAFNDFGGGGTIFSPAPLDAAFHAGADNGLFEVTGGNQLRFKTAPDFENPADANGDNVNEVTVLADDGAGGVTPQTIQVTVTDANETSASADFDGDGDVDGRDFLAWQRGFGAPNALKADGDADNDSDVDGDDLDIWQLQYGTAPPLAALSQGSSAESQEPELGSRLRGNDGNSQQLTSELVDLALAVEWMKPDAKKGELFIETQLVAEETALDAVFASGDLLPVSALSMESESYVIESHEGDIGEKPWRANELLERVVGEW